MAHEPVLLADRPRQQQVLLAGVVPAVFGAIAGVVLGLSAPVYWVLQVLATIGAFGAGFEHLGAASGAKRGVISGALYGAFLLLAHAISGTHAKVSLGSAPILLIVITAAVGALGGAVGGALRARRSASVRS